jgi:hypothetical protein
MFSSRANPVCGDLICMSRTVELFIFCSEINLIESNMLEISYVLNHKSHRQSIVSDCIYTLCDIGDKLGDIQF